MLKMNTAKKDKVKISFDFDGTIEHYFGGTENKNREKIQNLFREFHNNENIEVYIITRRFDSENSHKGNVNEHIDVFNFAQSVGFPIEKVFFTNRNYKFAKIKELEINIHLDDEELEIHYIKHWSRASGVHVEHPDWETKLESALKFHS